MRMILNSIPYLFLSILCSSLFAVSNEGMEYTLSIDKNEIRDDEIIINLKADINIDKGYYVQSCDPDLSLNPTI